DSMGLQMLRYNMFNSAPLPRPAGRAIDVLREKTNMHSRLHPLTLAIGLTLAPAAWSATIELDSSLIRASALDTPAQQMTTPAAVLDGDALVLRREATLGDTLDSLPGVRASGFGAGASRPQIRGLD